MGQQISLLKAKDLAHQQVDSQPDSPETKSSGQDEHTARLLHDNDLLVSKLSSERDQLLEEVERLRRVNEVLSSSNSVSGKSASAKGGKVGGVSRSVTGQSLNSLQQTSKSDALVVSLNKEVGEHI